LNTEFPSRALEITEREYVSCNFVAGLSRNHQKANDLSTMFLKLIIRKIEEEAQKAYLKTLLKAAGRARNKTNRLSWNAE
jgi:hypothetical protein